MQYNGHSHLATPENISEAMNVSYDTLRRKLKYNGFEVFKKQPLSPEAVIEALTHYAKDESTRSAAKEIADHLKIELDAAIIVPPPIEQEKEPELFQEIEVITEPEIKPVENKIRRWTGRPIKKKEGKTEEVQVSTKEATSERWIKSLILSTAIPFAIYSYAELFIKMTTEEVVWYLYIIFITAVCVQIEHTCVMAYRSSTVSNEVVRWASSVLFAISFQFTGFILTVHSGDHWYLITFAIAEVLINIFYYSPWKVNKQSEQ